MDRRSLYNRFVSQNLSNMKAITIHSLVLSFLLSIASLHMSAQAGEPDSVWVQGVVISDYGVTVDNNTVKLSWTTLNEQNAWYFLIERMSTTGEVEIVGTVNAEGTSTDVLVYTFDHSSVNEGTWYYRVIAVDHNGTRQEFDWKAAVVEKAAPCTVFPNPCSGNFVLHLSSEANVVVTEFDGRVLWSNQCAKGDYTIPVTDEGSRLVNILIMHTSGKSDNLRLLVR